MKDLVHLEVLYREELEFGGKGKANAENPEKDKNGSASNMYAYRLIFLANAEYLLHKNISKFRANMAEASRLKIQLFERFEAGGVIDKSYVSMIAYKGLFYALATGDEKLSQTLANYMGGREQIEKDFDSPFAIAIGYTLKYLVLGENSLAKTWLEKLKLACKGDYINFVSLANLLETILNKDSVAMNTAFSAFIADYKKECKGRGMFSDSEEEMLSVWGIGLANLACMRGMSFTYDNELTPRVLVVT